MGVRLRTLIRRSAISAVLAAILGAVTPCWARGQTCSDPGFNEDLQRACLGVEKLQSWYNPNNGLWHTTNWWNAANAVTVLVNYSTVSGSQDHRWAVENTFDVNARRPSQFLNFYYDDEGWWALAWIRAYDWTHDPKYLDMSKTIFDDMAGGWDDVCGGGIWWSKEQDINKRYKNAIANELFLSVAAGLANRVAPAEQPLYSSWAQSEWDWFQQSGMINSENLINDGLVSAGTSPSCVNNGKTTWSYNQGVILGGLVELFGQTQDPSLADTANSIASAAIAKLSDSNGIFHDRCEARCGADGVQFKGIFVRNLMALNDFMPDDRYMQFVRTNAASIWDTDQGPDNEFGQVWSGPFSPSTNTNAAIQTSALDVLVAAAELFPAPSSNVIAQSTPMFRFSRMAPIRILSLAPTDGSTRAWNTQRHLFSDLIF